MATPRTPEISADSAHPAIIVAHARQLGADPRPAVAAWLERALAQVSELGTGGNTREVRSARHQCTRSADLALRAYDAEIERLQRAEAFYNARSAADEARRAQCAAKRAASDSAHTSQPSAAESTAAHTSRA